MPRFKSTGQPAQVHDRFGVNTVTGQLKDFIPRPGDNLPNNRGVGTVAQKWGGRQLFSNDPALLGVPQGQSKQRDTLIKIADMGQTKLLNIQLRFAPIIGGVAPNRNETPRLPFTYDVTGGVNKFRVYIRRTVDRTAGPIEDVFDLFPEDTLPCDIVLARELEVTVEALPLGSPGQAWCEAAATCVDYPSPKNLVHPYDIVNTQRFEATTAVGVRLLPANKDRYHFTVCNTSTDADLLIGFASPQPDNGLPPVPVWPSTNGAFVLPRNQFAVYESPAAGCFKGNVMGVWSNAGNGGALIMEGTNF